MKVKLDHDSDTVEPTESFINSVNNTQLDLCFPLSYLKLHETLFRSMQQVLKLLRKGGINMIRKDHWGGVEGYYWRRAYRSLQ